MNYNIKITEDLIDGGRELDSLHAGNNSTGAVVTFFGYVRDANEGQAVEDLFLEHYPGMVEAEISRIIEEAGQRWPLETVRVVHRIGHLGPGEPIVFVGVGSAHRAEAFSACEFIMDFLKTRAPFWKKEQDKNGASRWLDARDSDTERARRW